MEIHNVSGEKPQIPPLGHFSARSPKAGGEGKRREGRSESIVCSRNFNLF
jgi:hypothetical protein